MFEPQHKSKWYLILIFAVAYLIGWSAFRQYKPFIIQTSCSEVAARSSDFLYKNSGNFESSFSYESVKQKCIKESGVQ